MAVGSFPGHCQGKFYAGVIVAPSCIDIVAVVRLQVVQLILFITCGNRSAFDGGVGVFAEPKCRNFSSTFCDTLHPTIISVSLCRFWCSSHKVTYNFVVV